MLLSHSHHRSAADLRQDLKWGLAYSAGFTGFFGAIAIVGRILAGPEFSRLPITTLIAIYIVLGAVTGVLVGVFRPLTHSKVGSGGIGAIVGMFLAVLVHVATAGWSNWTSPGEVALTVIFIFAGAVGGVSMRRGWERAEARSGKEP
jgi:uncharacterized membrane protein